MKNQIAASRIEYLDILRGLSICFICFANLVIFSGYLFYTPDFIDSLSTATFDKVLYTLQVSLIQGKFYTLFTLLFGIGMVIQYQSFNDDIKAFRKYMSKRLVVLFLIALIHIWFIWLGDIITFYALLGLLALTVFQFTNRTLLIMALVLIIFPVIHTLLLGIIGFYPGIFFATFSQIAQGKGVPTMGLFEQALFLAMNQDLGLYVATKLYDPLVRLGLVLAEGRLFKLFGILCLGIVVGRAILNDGLLSNVKLLKKVMILGCVIGLPFNIAYAVFSAEQSPTFQILLSIFYALGVVPLALSYAAALALLIHNGSKVFDVFIPLGRMALTNYLTQSVIAIAVFNGIGIGLAGYYGLSIAWAIGICILLLQWLFSNLWLSKFKQGPIEYLWRKSINK